ncbi:MAG: hypothetical protein KAX20_01960 [Candidatus Omnitrophica bacterium]|nr:hypothetical protein [Candidatus Omnitrophota bacterium]
MIKEPKSMEEIHKIREKLYEEEKDLTVEDLIAKIHREAEEVEKNTILNYEKLYLYKKIYNFNCT